MYRISIKTKEEVGVILDIDNKKTKTVYDVLMILREKYKDPSIMDLKLITNEKVLSQLSTLSRARQVSRQPKLSEAGGATKDETEDEYDLYVSVNYDEEREKIFDKIKEDVDEYDLHEQKYKIDKEIILNVMEQNGHELYADLNIEMRKDKDIALAAVKNSPFILMHLPPSLRNDKEINIVGLSHKNTPALFYASAKLMYPPEPSFKTLEIKKKIPVVYYDYISGDKDMVRLAVKHCEYALQFASEELLYDVDFVYEMLQINWKNYIYIPNVVINGHKKLKRYVEESKKKYYDDIYTEGSDHTSDEDEDENI